MKEKVKIMINQAMHSVMLSCDKATFLITKKEYQKLSCMENLQLKMHLMGCKFCRAFNKQNAVITEKLHTLIEDPPQAELSAKKKAVIEKVLTDIS